MKTIVCIIRKGTVSAALAVSVFIAGCGLDQSGVQPLTGPTTPSEFGLSVTMSATPDQLPRDGRSQATVTVKVREFKDGQMLPKNGQRLSVFTNAGTVSPTEVVTAGEGTVTFTFTAPTNDVSVAGDAATISVFPVGNNFDNAVARSLSIGLVGVSNTAAPVPSFTFAPAAPERLQRVTFDATGTKDEGVACMDACVYIWKFDDEEPAVGRVATHSFLKAQTYVVTLTVRDKAGTFATSNQTVVVVNPAAPVASFVASPSTPAVAQAVQFSAAASTVASGHTLVEYRWSFGDDGLTYTTTGPTTSHAYAITGIFSVALTVKDDVGQERSTTGTVTVVAGIAASFTVSPTNPLVGVDVYFNGSGSTANGGATITTWDWDFGDGSTGTGQTASHSYSTGGGRIYTVRLTVTDSLGRKATTTLTLTVTG